MRAIAAALALALLQVPAALPPTRDQLFALLGGYLESLRVQAGIPGMAAAIMDNAPFDATGEHALEVQRIIGRLMTTKA